MVFAAYGGRGSLEESVRTRLFALGVCFVLVLGGCSGTPAPPQAPPPADIVRPPAASAGGACILWDYPEISKALGVTFNVAAADQADDVSTCVVQTEGASRPDLVLSIVERTEADAALFTKDLAPAKATTVKGLGKAAYQSIAPAAADHGATIEIGWLTADKQLMSLRFTFAKGTPQAEANPMAGKLVGLAKILDSGEA
jgi:hypothetical protein